jgi:hypothetical protein
MTTDGHVGSALGPVPPLAGGSDSLCVPRFDNSKFKTAAELISRVREIDGQVVESPEPSVRPDS